MTEAEIEELMSVLQSPHEYGPVVLGDAALTAASLLREQASEIDTLTADHLKTIARVGELESRLKPFADIATAYEQADAVRAEQRADAGLSTYERSDHHRVSCELGDCRRARALLSPEAGGKS
jgi:hypothetical protein